MKIQLPKEPATVLMAVVLAEFKDGSFATYLMDVDYAKENGRDDWQVGFFNERYFAKEDRSAADKDFCERIESRMHYYQECINIATNRR
jgi:hypothetical protein